MPGKNMHKNQQFKIFKSNNSLHVLVGSGYLSQAEKEITFCKAE